MCLPSTRLGEPRRSLPLKSHQHVSFMQRFLRGCIEIRVVPSLPTVRCSKLTISWKPFFSCKIGDNKVRAVCAAGYPPLALLLDWSLTTTQVHIDAFRDLYGFVFVLFAERPAGASTGWYQFSLRKKWEEIITRICTNEAIIKILWSECLLPDINLTGR